MLSAWDGKPLKSTKLGAATNEALTVQGCPTVQLMRHVREHFSTELMMSDTQLLSKATASAFHNRSMALAILSSNHSVDTGVHHYAGVYERNGVGGLRVEMVRQMLAYSCFFNEVVLGFAANVQMISCTSKSSGCESTEATATVPRLVKTMKRTGPESVSDSYSSYSSGVDFFDQSSSSSQAATVASGPVSQPNGHPNWELLAKQLQVQSIRPLQRQAATLLLGAQPHDTKLIVAPTSMGKDLLPFLMARATNTVQILFVPLLTLVDGVEKEGIKYNCKVVKFSSIAKRKISVETAAATAHVVVCSYEHASSVNRLAQELQLRGKLGTFFRITGC